MRIKVDFFKYYKVTIGLYFFVVAVVFFFKHVHVFVEELTLEGTLADAFFSVEAFDRCLQLL